MKLIFDQFYLLIKLNLLMMSFVGTPTSGSSSEVNYAVRKIAKPGAVPQHARTSALTRRTATVVPLSHGDPEICIFTENINITGSKNQLFLNKLCHSYFKSSSFAFPRESLNLTSGHWSRLRQKSRKFSEELLRVKTFTQKLDRGDLFLKSNVKLLCCACAN